jgi:hypothetical protein
MCAVTCGNTGHHRALWPARVSRPMTCTEQTGMASWDEGSWFDRGQAENIRRGRMACQYTPIGQVALGSMDYLRAGKVHPRAGEAKPPQGGREGTKVRPHLVVGSWPRPYGRGLRRPGKLRRRVMLYASCPRTGSHIRMRLSGVWSVRHTWIGMLAWMTRGPQTPA